MSKPLAQLREELAAKRQQLAAIFDEAGPDLDMSQVKSLDGDSAAKAAEIKRRNTELTELGKQLEAAQGLAAIHEENQKGLDALTAPVNRLGAGGTNGKGREQERAKTVREMLDESAGYKAYRAGAARSMTLEIPVWDVKTLVTLSTINAQNTRRPGIVPMAIEERTVADMLAQGTTDGNTIEYYEETTFTNAAAPVAEGGTKPESAVAYTLRTESVRKIAHNIPLTDEALNDVPQLESIITNRLVFGVQRTEEVQILTGNGTAPNLLGILNRSGIQTQAKGADPTPDAVYKAMTKIRNTGFAEPDSVVFHPNDWQDIKLLRTADGIYIWGSPSEEGPDRIWGLPVRITTAITENTGLVGAFRMWAQLFRRQGITVTASSEHSTFFAENKILLQAESRIALAVYRPAAFATVTGI